MISACLHICAKFSTRQGAVLHKGVKILLAQQAWEGWMMVEQIAHGRSVGLAREVIRAIERRKQEIEN